MANKKYLLNRFAGADGVYETKKFIVREDVSTDKSGKCLYHRQYIRKSPKAWKEFRAVFGPKTDSY